jgi:hypothetical protein
MNHTIKGIIIVVTITSMLIVGATTMIPIMQNSLAHKKSTQDRQAEGLPISFPGVPGGNTNTNTNANTNTADSSSSSSATADNTNNINNTATASNSQEQSACAVAVTCPEGSTTVTPPTPPADPCPHSPYTDFVAGTGCQDGEPQTTCNPSTVGGITATPTDGSCTAILPADHTDQQFGNLVNECITLSHNGANPGVTLGPNGAGLLTCTFPSTPQTCPTPTGSTQTPTIVNGRCTIEPETT